MLRTPFLFSTVAALSVGVAAIRAEDAGVVPTVADAAAAADADAAPKAQVKPQARTVSRSTRSVQPARRGPVAKLIELERRKNEWLRETFLNR